MEGGSQQEVRPRGHILRDIFYERRGKRESDLSMSDGEASRDGGGKWTGCSLLFDAEDRKAVLWSKGSKRALT